MSEVRARYPLAANAATGLAKAIRTGETQFMPDVTDASLPRKPTARSILQQFSSRTYAR